MNDIVTTPAAVVKPRLPKPQSMVLIGEQTQTLFENARLAKERGEKVGWSASIFPQEIAETLEVSPKTVDYRIQQALKQLRIDLKDYLPLLLPLLFP